MKSCHEYVKKSQIACCDVVWLKAVASYSTFLNETKRVTLSDFCKCLRRVTDVSLLTLVYCDA